jgi:hypothetical protein
MAGISVARSAGPGPAAGGTVRCFANDLALLALRPRQSESPTTASPVARRTLKSSRAKLALCDRVSGAVSAFAGAALRRSIGERNAPPVQSVCTPPAKSKLFLGVLTTPLLSRAFEVGDSQSPSSSIRKCSVPRKLFVHPSTVGGRQKRRVIFMSKETLPDHFWWQLPTRPSRAGLILCLTHTAIRPDDSCDLREQLLESSCSWKYRCHPPRSS